MKRRIVLIPSTTSRDRMASEYGRLSRQPGDDPAHRFALLSTLVPAEETDARS
jgi:hypothetical protein